MQTTYQKFMKMTTEQLKKLEPRLQKKYADAREKTRSGEYLNFNSVDYAIREWETCKTVLMIKGVVC